MDRPIEVLDGRFHIRAMATEMGCAQANPDLLWRNGVNSAASEIDVPSVREPALPIVRLEVLGTSGRVQTPNSPETPARAKIIHDGSLSPMVHGGNVSRILADKFYLEQRNGTF